MGSPATVEVAAARGPQARDFIALPYRIYRDDPRWVPFLVPEIRRALSRRHVFFSHSDAAFYIVRRGEEVTGRIGVLENRAYNRYRDRRDASFYYFECFDDPESADRLFDAAATWARSRGLDRVKGPQGFTAMAGGGILIDGFEHRAAMTMMCYHPPYYRTLLEGWGFEKHEDYYSARLDPRTFRTPDRIRRVVERILRRGRFRIPALRTKRQVREVAGQIGEIFNDAWGDHQDSAPLSPEEIRLLTADLLLVTDPELVKVVMTGDEVAGFMLAFPDLSAAIQRYRGRLTPMALLALMSEKRRTRRLIFNGVGVRPRYQGLGVNALLYHALERAVRGTGRDFVDADLPQIADSTQLVLSDLQTLGTEIRKVHRVFRKAL